MRGVFLWVAADPYVCGRFYAYIAVKLLPTDCRFWLCSVICTLILAANTYAQGPAKVFRCPEEAPAVEQQAHEAPKGWEIGKQTVRLWLYGITLFDGPIAENASLAPDGRRKAGAKLEDVWKLDPASGRQLWLQCAYANTTITLSKPLGKGFRECVARYNPDLHVAGEPAMELLRCR